MGSSKIFLLLVAATAVAGATFANVSPGDQGNPKAGLRSALPESSVKLRSKPGPVPLVVSRRRRVPAPQRIARQSSGAGSYASSGAGSFSGNYQGDNNGNNPAGFGFAGAGNQFPSFPFNNPNPMGVMPFDVNSLFQYFQQMQQQFQQNALNQGSIIASQFGAGPISSSSSSIGTGLSTGPISVSSIATGPLSSSSIATGHVSSSSIDKGPLATSSSWPSHVALEDGSKVPIISAYASYAASLPQKTGERKTLTNSYGIASREGDLGPNGFSKVSSHSYSNNAIGGGPMDNVASYMGSGQGYSDGASAVASIGPQGGYGSANLYPDLGNRFGSESGHVPPPSGGNVGVFTSSSSGSSDINGHRTSYKTATSGINDNGKITSFTVRDPPK